MPFLNSLTLLPRLRASEGSLVLPNRSRTITRMMMSSVTPIFWKNASEDNMEHTPFKVGICG